MTDNEIPPMEPLAPIVDQIREIAQEELPAPRTMRIRLWDDGDYDIYVYHSGYDDEGQRVVYDNETGAILWQYRKGASIETTFVSEEYGEFREPVYEHSEERELATIEQPTE